MPFPRPDAPQSLRASRKAPRGWSRLRRLGRDNGGATAVEFAMIAGPFFILLFAILELGVVFIVDSTLENAVISTGRLVRTGQAQEQNMTPEEFKAAMCSRMSIFKGDCVANASVDVREITSFNSPPPEDPTAGGTFDDSDLVYDPGTAGSLVLVRAWYRHPIVTPFLAQAVSRLGDGSMLLTVTTAFRNEPYDQ